MILVRVFKCLREFKILLACLLRLGIWSVNICDDSIVLSSVSLDLMLFDLVTGVIVVAIVLARFIFSPEYSFLVYVY